MDSKVKDLVYLIEKLTDKISLVFEVANCAPLVSCVVAIIVSYCTLAQQVEAITPLNFFAIIYGVSVAPFTFPKPKMLPIVELQAYTIPAK